MAKNKGGGGKSGGNKGGGGGSLGAQVKAAGAAVSKSEAQQISQSTGKTVAEVMAKAQGLGIGLTAGLVNNFNSGNLGPNGNNLSLVMGKIPVAMGQSSGTTAALAQLQALQGLHMQPKTLYAGYSTTSTPGQSGNDPASGSWHTPGSTTYNPIVVPKGYTVSKTPAPAPAPTTGPIQNWENSVNNSNQELIDSINAQIKANQAQADLYMGQINDLMAAMQQQSQNGGLNSIVPYAVTTSTVDAATGAKTTSAITPRRKPLSTDLSISPLVSSLAGTGLNIGI